MQSVLARISLLISPHSQSLASRHRLKSFTPPSTPPLLLVLVLVLPAPLDVPVPVPIPLDDEEDEDDPPAEPPSLLIGGLLDPPQAAKITQNATKEDGATLFIGVSWIVSYDEAR